MISSRSRCALNSLRGSGAFRLVLAACLGQFGFNGRHPGGDLVKYDRSFCHALDNARSPTIPQSRLGLRFAEVCINPWFLLSRARALALIDTGLKNHLKPVENSKPIS
jgi:hypothetical protein